MACIEMNSSIFPKWMSTFLSSTGKENEMYLFGFSRACETTVLLKLSSSSSAHAWMWDLEEYQAGCQALGVRSKMKMYGSLCILHNVHLVTGIYR